MKIKDIPIAERPRERLRTYGASSLSNEELLAILLQTGTKMQSAKDVSLSLLACLGDIHQLASVSFEMLVQMKGIGEAKAVLLLASFELGKRIYLELPHCPSMKLQSPKSIYLLCQSLFHGQKQECFYCLYLNQKQELIERKLLFMGTLNRSLVHPREVFKEAYLTSASAIICMHNHPSGDVRPSMEDLRLTRALVEIGELNGIPILDHIIVSDQRYYSMMEHDLLKKGIS